MRVVDRDVGRDGGRAARLLVGGEPGEREAQVAVAGVAEEAGGADDGRLAGAGELGEAGDGEGGAAGRVARDGFGDPLHGAGHGGGERPHLGREGGGGGRVAGRPGAPAAAKISFTSWVTSERYFRCPGSCGQGCAQWTHATRATRHNGPWTREPPGAGAARGPRPRARRSASRARSPRRMSSPSSRTRSSQRRWWVEQWPEGAEYVAGLVAQDVQDALLERYGRWPLCPVCGDGDPHALDVEPELGPDPHWVCHKAGVKVAAVGGAGRSATGGRRPRDPLHRPAHLAGTRPPVVPPGQRRLVRRTARVRRRVRRARRAPSSATTTTSRPTGTRTRCGRGRWRSAAARWCGCCTASGLRQAASTGGSAGPRSSR